MAIKVKSKTQVKVKTTNLKVGMFVADVGVNWLRHPWKTKSKLITSTAEIKQLLDLDIREVIVDTAKSAHSEGRAAQEYGVTSETVDAAGAVSMDEIHRRAAKARSSQPASLREVERRRKPRPQKPGDEVALQDELPQARQTYDRALDVSREFVEDVRAGRKIKMDNVRSVVDDMIDSVFRNRDALAAMLKLRNYDEYTFTHSVNVTALSVSVGRQINMTREQLMHMGVGAMFHDVGKTGIPDSILNKPDRLTEEEFEVMKRHPALGEEFLLGQFGQLPREVRSIVRHHHERVNGSGYPDGLKENDLTPFTYICGLADVYDALSSERVYKKGLLPQKALKIIFTMRGEHFPPPWVDRFIYCLGIFPAGTTVRLTTKEVGVVVSVNHASLAHPKVRILRRSDGLEQVRPRVVDLADPAESDCEIAEVLDPEKYDIDPALSFAA